VKHPLAWYTSIGRYNGHKGIGAGASDFRRVEAHKPTIEHWNRMNRHWLGVTMTSAKRNVLLRYEDLLADPEGEVTRIARMLGWKRKHEGKFKCPEKKMTRKGTVSDKSFEPGYYLGRKYLADLTEAQAKKVWEAFDKDLCFRLGYARNVKQQPSWSVRGGFPMSLAIVGNGPAELHTNNGEKIDGFEYVARMNNFTLDGYKRAFGRRTDFWVSFLGGPKNPSELDEVRSRDEEFQRVYIPFPFWGDTKPDGSPRRNRAMYDKWKNRIVHIPDTIWKDLKKIHPACPTTGFAFLYWYWKVNGVLRREQVFGFNFWHGEDLLNYWSEKPVDEEYYPGFKEKLLKGIHYRKGNIERNLFEEIVT
jgi:hypothetical protein